MRGYFCLIAVVLSASLGHAETLSQSLKWDALAPVAVGQRLVVELKDGSAVKGVPASIEPAALVLEVTSSGHPTYKKGRASIPRTDITALRVVSRSGRGREGLTWGILAGLGGGVGIGVATRNCRPGLFGESCDRISGAAAAGAVAVMAASPLAGYLIGRHIGHNETRITILPE